ncbi:Transcription factor PDR1 [Fusarium oxysporum f. sp. albedinis]|nr:Transcription factor PDR1 [Fusarium oxysporum f. sp. albedinis]
MSRPSPGSSERNWKCCQEGTGYLLVTLIAHAPHSSAVYLYPWFGPTLVVSVDISMGKGIGVTLAVRCRASLGKKGKRKIVSCHRLAVLL